MGNSVRVVLTPPVSVLPSSRYALIDPNSDEERLMDGFVSISMNQHKEICGIHMGGRIGLKKDQVDLCKKLAFNKVLELTDRIRQVVTDYYKYELGTGVLLVRALARLGISSPWHTHSHRSYA